MCPFQGSRTIRTEEAVLISLARLSPFLSSNKEVKAAVTAEEDSSSEDFSDDSPSDESSDEED